MIALDTNVLMEILEERPHLNAVMTVMTAVRNNKSAPLAISTLTVSHLFYLAERRNVPLLRVEALLESFCLLAVQPLDVAWALARYRQNDFEDALQVAAAIREGCTGFMTLDKELAEKYRSYLSIELIA